MMWCPEISGDFLVCVLGGCVLFGFCFVSGELGKGLASFYTCQLSGRQLATCKCPGSQSCSSSSTGSLAAAAT